jgi:hypothetical protein
MSFIEAGLFVRLRKTSSFADKYPTETIRHATAAANLLFTVPPSGFYSEQLTVNSEQ